MKSYRMKLASMSNIGELLLARSIAVDRNLHSDMGGLALGAEVLGLAGGK